MEVEGELEIIQLALIEHSQLIDIFCSVAQLGEGGGYCTV